MSKLKKILIVLFIILSPLFLVEGYYKYFHKNKDNHWWMYPKKPIPISSWISSTKENTKVSLSLPNLNYSGPIPWEKEGKRNKDLTANINSNEHGFYTPYNFKSLKTKSNNEFRIVVIGGSGAQGHGATENKKMFAYILESLLNNHFKQKKVRVINLASQGHESVNNLKILREFGHDIQPDLILAYNGANDIYRLPQMFKRGCSQKPSKYLNSSFYNPEWIKTLGNYFPVLLYQTGLDRKIKRKFYLKFYQDLAHKECFSKWDIPHEKINHYPTVFKKIIKTTFVRSFKSVKRDFCGIPIALFFQPVHEGERIIYEKMFSDLNSKSNPPIYFMGDAKTSLTINNPYNKKINIFFKNKEAKILYTFKGEDKKTFEISSIFSKDDLKNKNDLMYNFINDDGQKVLGQVQNFFDIIHKKENLYRNFYGYVSEELNNYMNSDWLLFDLDKHFQDNKMFSKDKVFVTFLNDPSLMEDSIGIHLDNLGHRIVAKEMYLKLKKPITKYINQKNHNNCF